MGTKGFSLAEMIIVLGFVVIGFLPLLLLFSDGIVFSENTSKSSAAVLLAQQKLEQLKLVSWAGIAASSEAYGSITGYPSFQRAVSVSEAMTNLKAVTVSVSWQTSGVSDSLSLETYFANY